MMFHFLARLAFVLVDEFDEFPDGCGSPFHGSNDR